MRQIATLADSGAAQQFADFLLTMKIETRILPEPEGWSVWVCDEDRVDQARQELADFTQNPADPRYRSASATASALRQEESRKEEKFRRRQQSVRRQFVEGGSNTLNFTLIALSVLVTIASSGSGLKTPWLQDLFITRFEIIGRSIFFAWPSLPEVMDGQVWRLVTPIFIHLDILHLFFNMYMLYILGGQVESRRGTARYLLLVLILAVCSNLTQFYLGHLSFEGGRPIPGGSPQFGGMSGVLYGLFGYLWMKTLFEPHLGLYVDRSTVVILLGWFFLCLTGMLGNIANGAHAGGLVVGILLGYAPVLVRRLREWLFAAD